MSATNKFQAFAIILAGFYSHSLFSALNNPAHAEQPINNLSASAISCTYRLTFRIDTVAKYPRTEYFRLLIFDNKSIFQSTKQIQTDSIYDSYEAMPFSQETVDKMSDAISKAPQAEFSYAVYKNLDDNIINYVDDIDPVKYSYPEPTTIFTWHIYPETKIINRYKCQLATTSFRGRYYNAWFTRQVPVADGPYKFCGLPGLIVQVQDKKGEYKFELTGLTESTASTTIMPPSKVISTTREKFLQGVTDFNNSFIERATQNKVTFSNPELARKTWQEKLDRRNNPLELR